MKLYEFQGKELFKKYGLKTPAGIAVNKDSIGEFAKKITTVNFPAMVKAQVQTGGRGKAGGINRALSVTEAQNMAEELLGKELKDCKIDAIFIEECVPFVEEYYLSVTLDSASRMPMIIFSKHGGVDIEEVAANNPENIAKVIIDPLIGLAECYFASLFRQGNVEETAVQNQLREVVRAIYALYNDYDCMLVEINPLMKLSDGVLIAADAKVEIDDSGIFRHPDLIEWREKMPIAQLEKEAGAAGCLYIDVEQEGSVGVISNGSGMIMSCLDGIARQGGKVACALDLSGGATAAKVAEGIRILSQNASVKVLMISIFGGITRCDEIANGILKATGEAQLGIPIVAKLDGTNKEKGMEILIAANREDITIGKDLKDASEKVLKALNAKSVQVGVLM